MKGKSHTVEVSDLTEWMKETEVLFASSSGEKKKLMVTLNGVFTVYQEGRVKTTTSVPGKAIKDYNDI